MYLTKNFILIAACVFCVICSVNALNAAESLNNPLNVKIQSDEKGIIHSFSYIIKGKNIGNERYTLDKIVKIERLPLDKYINKCIVVKIKSNIKSSSDGSILSSNDINNALSKLHGTLKPMFKMNKNAQLLSDAEKELSRIYEIHYTANVEPFDACLELLYSNDVEYVNPRYIRPLCSIHPNDPQVDKQWAVSELNMPDAWAISKGSKSVKIGIVDSGVNWYHEDLADNIWSNPNDTLDGIDNDGNGKIDDIRGWDFVGDASALDLQYGSYHEDNDPDNTVNDHGTYVSGCASAVTNNGIGISGFGYGCTLIPVKCGSELPEATGIYTGYEGIKYAADLGADIINCSWGGPGYDVSEEEAINYCINKGSLVVVSSGNDADNIDDIPSYPAAFKGTLTVGATEQNHVVAEYSNYGYKTTIFAPGTSILSTSPDNTYDSESGTSFACPITSGIAGLIKTLHPTWTAKQIWHQIRGTAKNNLVSNQSQRPKYWGLIDPVAALTINNGNNATMPGIGIDSVTLQGVSALKDMTEQSMIINIKNYLSASKNLKITLRPVDDFIELPQTTYNVGVLAENEDYNFAAKIKLTSMTPWYRGYARIEATYTDDNYVNVELIEIPIEIQSTNSCDFSGLGPIFRSLRMKWYNADGYDFSFAVAVGYTPLNYQISQQNFKAGSYYLKYQTDNVSPKYGRITNDQVTAISTINNTNYCVGTSPSNLQPYIYYTSNEGTIWDSSSVSTITSAIKDIHFFDDNNGIFIGEAKNNIWGIAKTTDAAQSWTIVNDIQIALPNEITYNSSNCWLEDCGWFGTSAGRVFFTKNRGQKWDTSSINGAKEVKFIAFSNANKGIALFNDDTDSTKYKVASSADGGKTWTIQSKIFDSNDYSPVRAFNLYSSDYVYVVFSDGRILSTNNQGVTWIPVLSEKVNNVTAAAAGVQIENYRARISLFGSDMATIAFNYLPVTAVDPHLGNTVISDFDVSIVPNPVGTLSQIVGNNDKDANFRFSVYSISGDKVLDIYNGYLKQGSYSFDLSSDALVSGVYFLRIDSDRGRMVKQFIVNK